MTSTFESLAALITLVTLEIVLGIDNIIFLTILSSRLPESTRYTAQRLGLGLALVTRVLLLLSISLLTQLTAPLFSLLGHEFSGKDLVMLAGGLFLLAKSTTEIINNVEDRPEHGAAHPGGSKAGRKGAFWGSLAGVVIQIGLLDIVFSLDSVITAIGMSNQVPVMVLAIAIAIVIMMLFARWVSQFVERHPSLKILGLSFLLLIGFSLMAEGLGQEIPKGYIYFSMFFAMLVELINMRYRRTHPSGENSPG
jgi:predicted tellurium resistance membrane protein TerC